MSSEVQNVVAKEIIRIFAEGMQGKIDDIWEALTQKFGEADDPNTFTYGIGLSCTIQHKDGAWIPQVNITWSVKHTATMRGNKCAVQREDPLEETPLGDQRDEEGERGAEVGDEGMRVIEGGGEPEAATPAPDQPEASKEKPNTTVTSQMVEDAMEIIRSTQRCSLGSLQKRMKLKNTMAAALIEHLEQCGFIGGPNGSQPREIKVDWDQYDRDRGVVPECDKAKEEPAAATK